MQRTFLVSSLLLLVTVSCSAETTGVVDENRNKMIGYMLHKQLPAIHFSDKKVDDTLSRAAFDLYLNQLDFQKRFLLAGDVMELERHALQIDDSLKSGDMVLPGTGHALLARRIAEVKTMVDDLMVAGFDPSIDDQYETDPEKLAFAGDSEELKQRWRRILKAQVISRFLDFKEEQKSGAEKKEDSVLWKEAIEKVGLRNNEFFNRLKQESIQDHYDRFFNSVARAFDPHTNYMPPDKKEDFDIHMRGTLEGIGALLREDDGLIKIVRIIPGSASAKQGGLGAEDTILQVAEGEREPIEVTDMRLRDAVRLIRGPKNTEVRLTVKKPDGRVLVIPIIREVVQIEDTFVKSTVLESPGSGKIGYIMIPSFYRDFEVSRNGGVARNSTDDTRLAIEELKKQDISGLVLDLRNNGGGSLVDAVDITGLFLKSGPVVQVKNSFGTRKVLEDEDDEIYYDGPMIVLVNLFSASASEILAAALQDYGRAIIVGGKHTHGKGTVQTIINMNDNVPFLHLKKYDDLGAIKVTIQKFYRINGDSTQYKGVEPDISLPSLYEHLKSGEQYLDHSLPWDQVEPVPFPVFTGPAVDLDKIRRNSLERVASDEGLKIIAEEASRSMARIEQTSISLKLEDMMREREEANTSREKVGAHFKQFQDDQLGDFEESPEQKGTEEGAEVWLEELKKDPYVGEVVRIFSDMVR